MNIDLYEKVKHTLLLKLNDDIVLVPDSYTITGTMNWYRKEAELDEDEEIFIDVIDLKNEGLWVPLNEKYDSEYNLITQLYNTIGFIEIKFEPNYELLNNISVLNGEVVKFITFEEYCMRYLEDNDLLEQPKILCSSNF